MIVREPHDEKRDRAECNPQDLFGIKRKRDPLVVRHTINRQDPNPQDDNDQSDKKDIVWAVPVFPAIVTSADCARVPVPSLTTPASASLISGRIPGLSFNVRLGTAVLCCSSPVARSITARTNRGRNVTPSFATVPI